MAFALPWHRRISLFTEWPFPLSAHPTPSGFNINLPAVIWFWITDFKDYKISRIAYHYGRGEWHSPSHATDAFPYLRNGTSPKGYPTPSGFYINLPTVIWFWITDFKDYKISRIVVFNYGRGKWHSLSHDTDASTCEEWSSKMGSFYTIYSLMRKRFVRFSTGLHGDILYMSRTFSSLWKVCW